MLELSDIEGVSEEDRRIVGLNITGGEVNAVEFCTRIYSLPQLSDLADAFMAEVGGPSEFKHQELPENGSHQEAA